jgi:hypothetical protein
MYVFAFGCYASSAPSRDGCRSPSDDRLPNAAAVQHAFTFGGMFLLLVVAVGPSHVIFTVMCLVAACGDLVLPDIWMPTKIAVYLRMCDEYCYEHCSS